jgi:hypothetical protein
LTHKRRQIANVQRKTGSCANREARLFFHFSEARFPKASIVEGAEVTFLAVPPPDEAGGRHLATSIQLLAPGTISASFEEDLPGKLDISLSRRARVTVGLG